MRLANNGCCNLSILALARFWASNKTFNQLIMIKKTLYFGNPAYFSCQNDQLVISIPHAKGIDKMLGNSIPVEDIGIVILDHQQLTITQHLLTKLLENNVALIIIFINFHEDLFSYCKGFTMNCYLLLFSR
jgi:hypothetical protein